jgi:hypothetical protein
LDLPRDFDSHIVRHALKVKDELGKGLSVVTLPLTDALETVGGALDGLPGGSEFSLKGSWGSVARLLQEQLCILLLLGQGLADQGTWGLVLVVVEVEDLFLCRGLVGVTRVCLQGSRTFAGDGVDGAEGRVDGVGVVGQWKALAGHVGESWQGSHAVVVVMVVVVVVVAGNGCTRLGRAHWHISMRY